MAHFRIHRLKEHRRQAFRAAPHTHGLMVVKPGDYEPGGEIEAASPYAAWSAMRCSDHPLEVGDLLENEQGQLRIYKYVGFEEAQWWTPGERQELCQATGGDAPQAQNLAPGESPKT